MKKLVLIGLLCFSQVAITQTTFQKTYGGSGDEQLYTVTQALDGGFIMSGETYSAGAGDQDFLLIKTDSAGNVEWANTYGGTGYDDIVVSGHFELADSGLIVTGRSESFVSSGDAAVIFKLDVDGNILWDYQFDGISGSYGNDWFLGGYELPDGNLMLSGGILAVGLGTNEAWACKLNSSGGLIWESYFSGSSNDHWNDIIPGPEKSSYLIGNSTSWGPGTRAGTIAHVDSLGVLQWMKGYGDSGWDSFVNGTSSPDGGIVAVFGTDSYGAGDFDYLVVHVDSLGNLVWTKTFGGADEDVAWAIVEEIGSGYIVSGRTSSFGAGGQDQMIIRIDYSGNLIEAKTLGTDGEELSLDGVDITSTGQMICSSSTDGFGAGGTDFFLQITDSTGSSLCQQIVPTISSPSLTQIDISPSMGPATAITDITLTQIPFPVTVNNVCFCSPTSYTLSDDVGFCHGDSIELTASGADSYIWTPSTGLSCDDCPNPTASPTTTTTYYVDLGWSGGCTITDSVVVTVFDLPIVELGGDTAICSDAVLTLDAGSGFDSYLWSTAETTQTIDFSESPGSWLIDVEVTDDNGCVNADTISISVQTELPYFVSEDTTICEGEETILSASGASAYSWTPTEGLSCSDCPNPTASPSITTTYYVELDSGTVCSKIDSVIVTVLEIDPIDLGADTSICVGESLTFDAGAGFDSYSWNNGDTTQTSLFSAPTGTWNIIIDATNANGCISTDTIVVTVIHEGIYSIANDTTICRGESVDLWAGGGETYSWSPDETLSCNDCPDPTATPGTTTTYTVDMSSGSGVCSATESVTITVIESAVIDLGDDTTICSGASLLLDAGPGFGSYLWSNGDTTQTSLFIAPVGTWTVFVNSTDQNNCNSVDTIVVTVVVCNGLEENPLTNLVALYPNPTDGLIHIQTSEPLSYSLLNSLGQVIQTEQVAPETIDMTLLPKGVYLLQLQHESLGVLSKKVIKN